MASPLEEAREAAAAEAFNHKEGCSFEGGCVFECAYSEEPLTTFEAAVKAEAVELHVHNSVSTLGAHGFCSACYTEARHALSTEG